MNKQEMNKERKNLFPNYRSECGEILDRQSQLRAYDQDPFPYQMQELHVIHARPPGRSCRDRVVLDEAAGKGKPH